MNPNLILLLRPHHLIRDTNMNPDVILLLRTYYLISVINHEPWSNVTIESLVRDHSGVNWCIWKLKHDRDEINMHKRKKYNWHNCPQNLKQCPLQQPMTVSLPVSSWTSKVHKTAGNRHPSPSYLLARNYTNNRKDCLARTPSQPFPLILVKLLLIQECMNEMGKWYFQQSCTSNIQCRHVLLCSFQI